MSLIHAHLSASIFSSTASIVADAGLAGIFFLMLLDSTCVPVLAEGTMIFAGFSVHTGQNSLVAVLVAGVGGSLVGSLLAFVSGRSVRECLDDARFGSGPRDHFALADRWFQRHGSRAVLVSRFIPLARTFVSLPAGASHMSYCRFTALTAIGTVPVVLGLGLTGQVLGDEWASAQGWSSLVDVVVVAATLCAVAWWLLRARQERGDTAGAPGC